MSVKIRLSRHGAKKRPYYRIVVADARDPRDGRFIEQLGTYDPRTPAATLKLDQAKVSDWIQKGAQPTQTVRNLIRRAAKEAGAVAENAETGAGNVEAAESQTVTESATVKSPTAEETPAAAEAAASAETPAAEAAPAESPATAEAAAPADNPVAAEDSAPAETPEAENPAAEGVATAESTTEPAAEAETAEAPKE